ncbi:MAG: acetate uptake transporter [Streptosporangiaceae bacterium]
MTENAVVVPPSAEPRRSLIANPVPVGVAGFALTTFTLGLYTSGQFNPAGGVLVLALAFFYGGLVQMIAGFFALAKGELFPAAFMTTYGAFWFSYVALLEFVLPRAGTGAAQAVTIFLIMWTIITLIFTVATLGTNWVVLSAFVVFDIAIILLCIGAAGAFTGVTKAGGYGEMVLAAIAWYIVMAEIANATIGRDLFPLFPFKNPPLRQRRPAAAL